MNTWNLTYFYMPTDGAAIGHQSCVRVVKNRGSGLE